MRAFRNFSIILLIVFFAVAFAIHKLQYLAYKEKNFKQDEFRKTLNLALEARNQGLRSTVAKQTLFPGRTQQMKAILFREEEPLIPSLATIMRFRPVKNRPHLNLTVSLFRKELQVGLPL